MLSNSKAFLLGPVGKPESGETGSHDMEAWVVRGRGGEQREHFPDFEKTPRP